MDWQGQASLALCLYGLNSPLLTQEHKPASCRALEEEEEALVRSSQPHGG